MPGLGPPPPGGDIDRASEVHAFTWTLESVALICVAARMYSRVKLTRNLWWDDWCICMAVVGILHVFSAISDAAGTSRHLISPSQSCGASMPAKVMRDICIT